MANFKYIRSNTKDSNGKIIYSGQKVNCHGRINQRELVEVFYEPNFGFRVQGNNFADAYGIEIVKDINLFQKIKGSILFFIYNLTGLKL